MKQPEGQYEDEYEVLDTPSSVRTWLQGLKLVQYTEAFIENGWDQVQFLGNMQRQDLRDIGVKDEQHLTKILQSLKDVGRSFRH